MTCTTLLNVLTIQIDQSKVPYLESGSLQITVYDVQNPKVSPDYGTGNFQLATYSAGGILVDQNMNFGSIGISNAYIPHCKFKIYK